MIRRFIQFLGLFLIGILINVLSAGDVLACYCESPLICSAYSRAKSVFIGKLEKIERDEAEKFYTINAFFSVEKKI